MPRSQNSPEPLNRRTLLTAGAAVAATATGATHLFRSCDAVAGGAPENTPPPPASAAPQRSTPTRPGPIAPTPAGTTLESVAVADGVRGDGSYRRLTEGPGWTREVREELAPAGGGREERRTTLAAFVQFTDLHIVDTQHPLRHEYLRAETASAWRPQETLSVHGALSLIDRVNALRHGPATGAPLDCVVTTGDNTDNNSRAELDWYLTAMSGGRITPNTGDPRGYEGVQNSGLPLYWHPESTLGDADKKLGYPRVDGLLTAATRRLTSPGLTIPWYSTVGNHDTLPGGCYASGDGFFADLAVGDRKLMELPREVSATLWRRVREGGDPRGEQFTALLKEYARNARTVTPDPARAPFTAAEYVRAHLHSRYTGAGPRGHGYTEANLAEDRLYYSFRISDDLIGISLDTTRPGGHYTGAVGAAQLRWLERELRAHRDTPVLVFSHHTSASTPDGGDQLLELLGRHPHVLAWVNGHSHKNAVTAHRGFWEVSTASHVDFPQLARVVEVTDNRDGSYSLFTTLIESAAPARTTTGTSNRVELASLYRELAHNAPGARSTLAGSATDRNTELLIRRS